MRVLLDGEEPVSDFERVQLVGGPADGAELLVKADRRMVLHWPAGGGRAPEVYRRDEPGRFVHARPRIGPPLG